MLQLSRWGLLDDIVMAGTPAVRRTVIRYGSTEEIVEIGPDPHLPALYAPRRTVLDRVLVDAAIRAGAEVRFRTGLTGLLRDRVGRVTGIEARDASGRPFLARAPLTIGADGARSRVAREVGSLTYAQGRHAGAMVMGYWSGIEGDGNQWLYGPRLAAGIIPTNDGRVRVWIATPSTSFAQQRDEPQLGLDRLVRTIAPDWAERLDRGRRCGPVRGFPGIAGYLRQPWGRGRALVGDASHFKDPLTTHGMTDAMRDAELLARALDDAAAGRRPRAVALAEYEQVRDGLSKPMFAATESVATFAWSYDQLAAQHRAMSRAMQAEVAHLVTLDRPAVPAA